MHDSAIDDLETRISKSFQTKKSGRSNCPTEYIYPRISHFALSVVQVQLRLEDNSPRFRVKVDLSLVKICNLVDPINPMDKVILGKQDI